MRRCNTDPSDQTSTKYKSQRCTTLASPVPLDIWSSIRKYGTGLSMNGVVYRDHPSDYGRELCTYDQRSLDNNELWQLREVMLYLARYTTGEVPNRPQVGSYGFKHIVERDAQRLGTGCYVSNGIGILAYRMVARAQSPKTRKIASSSVASGQAARTSLRLPRQTSRFRW